MSALSTRQRDLLKVLLNTSAPIGAEDLAAQMRLTPRQISYGLKGVRQWLTLHNIQLDVTPGVGIKLNCSEDEMLQILQDLESVQTMQLILSVEERRQLLGLILLVVQVPMLLAELERLAQVSRSTISKDLDEIEVWAAQHGMILTRRQNFGTAFDGGERLRQELITALLWGETPLGKPFTKITHKHGLVFKFHQDAKLLPLVEESDKILQQWNLNRVFGQVAYAEAQLGGRFTDDAVLHLSLVLAIQTERISNGHHLYIDAENIAWLKSLSVWDVASMVAKRLGWKLSTNWRDTDIAGIAMYILTAPRNERWPGDLEIDTNFEKVMNAIMAHIAEVFDTPEMENDRTLHDGIVNHVVPACLRQKLNLWMPSLSPTMTLSKKFEAEHQAAHSVVAIVEKETGLKLPATEISNIAALLRAARIRIRPYRFQKVIVVCPSGMATAQLLVARLEARFPRLGPLSVVSLRKLDDGEVGLDDVDLIIATVPLEESISEKVDVLQVHPLLLPEDVERITAYLT